MQGAGTPACLTILGRAKFVKVESAGAGAPACLTNLGGAKFVKEESGRGGFEPPIEGHPIHAFQACAFSHSAISPQGGEGKRTQFRAAILRPSQGQSLAGYSLSSTARKGL